MAEQFEAVEPGGESLELTSDNAKVGFIMTHGKPNFFIWVTTTFNPTHVDRMKEYVVKTAHEFAAEVNELWETLPAPRAEQNRYGKKGEK